MTRWSVRYYRDSRGRKPVAEFFELPSTNGITKAERAKFLSRLEAVQDHGLALQARQSDVLESIKGHENLYSIRLKGTTNNPRVLACALAELRCIVLLHAFKENDKSAYRRALPFAAKRRDHVVEDPGRWVANDD